MKNKLSLLLIFLIISTTAFAQSTNDEAITAEDYEHAASFLYANVMQYIDHNRVNPHWLNNGRFWFIDNTKQGYQFVLIDPHNHTRKPAFNHKKLAGALSKITDNNYNPFRLPFRSFRYSQNENKIYFSLQGTKWKCELDTYSCIETDISEQQKNTSVSRHFKRISVESPNGKWAAFIKDWNLWVRNLETGNDIQLTTKGVKNFGYATANASWRHSKRPVLRWSPDSKKIATYRQDQRMVDYMYLTSTQVGMPDLKKWKYALPIDSTIMQIHRVIINVPKRNVIPLDIPSDPRRSTQLDDMLYEGHMVDVQWSPNSKKVAFVSTGRYHKVQKVRIADAMTGEVRTVFTETVPTQYTSGYGGLNWRYLTKSNEFIWFSQRDNWGHLYLYDAKTGELKHQITEGKYVVMELLRVDQEERVIYFMLQGLQKENPYFDQFAKINFDGTGFQILTPEPGTHEVTIAPSGKYFIDTYSQPDVPPVTVLRTMEGEKLMTIAQTDISRLLAQGWKPPKPVKVKSHVDSVDIYGFMFTPTNLDRSKEYPVIVYIYPGPQGGSVRGWSWMPARGDNQALAELGFVVLAIEGTCNPGRTKSYQDMCYGNIMVNTLPDQITAVKQLAKRYSFIDTSRVGIWGHSGGGLATVDAMFNYPNFFDVGVAESGDYDLRMYESDWSDRYNGPISDSLMAARALQNHAEGLEGHLLLTHGLMDSNVPPQNTFLVVQALIEANKDFDLIVYPSSGHGYNHYYYQMKQRWDYFVKYLLDKTPPEEFVIEPEWGF